MEELGRCIRHPDVPAFFRCRQCHEPVCVGCQEVGERDLCDVCARYHHEVSDRAHGLLAGEESEPPPGRRRRLRYLLGLVVALNVALAVYLVATRRPDPAIGQGLEAVGVVARAVEESRDPAGRYPISLAPIVPRLPEPVAALVRADVIRYETDARRSEYRLSLVFRPSRSPRPGP